MMINVNNMSYGLPEKELYEKVSFTIDAHVHCAFIGTNGTGKSTLAQMLIAPQEYLYDGKITIENGCRIGYVSQAPAFLGGEDMTVFAYISQPFLAMQQNIDYICKQMETGENMDMLMEQYQQAWDAFCAVDGDHYESNISKQLKVAKLEKVEQLPVSQLSGGEFKLVQIVKEMLLSPALLIMDEPDGFLDFEHLNGLCSLINGHKGTLLVITHNRYLLHHCFDKILHLEDAKIQEFDGNYEQYQTALLQNKIELQEMAVKDRTEIERNEKLVEKLRKEATAIDSARKGRSLKARVTMLERLRERCTKDPFVDVFRPEIYFHTEEEVADIPVLTLKDYEVSFKELLLTHVNAVINAGEKVAIVGPNGAGKTTLLREIYGQKKDSIVLGEQTRMSYLSQSPGETLDEKKTVREVFAQMGFDQDEEIKEYMNGYGILQDSLDHAIGTLSGGEKNLLQLALLAIDPGNLLLLDEPTSHLDLHSQLSLEQALKEYNGSILMVSHDFYTMANTMDYVLLIENQEIRKVSIRKFRKMIYANYFDKNYVETEQKKKDLECRIAQALQKKAYEEAKKLAEKL